MLKIGIISDYTQYKKIKEYHDEELLTQEYYQNYLIKYGRKAPKNTRVFRDVFVPIGYDWVELLEIIKAKYEVQLVSIYRSEKYNVLRFYWVDNTNLKTVKLRKQDIHGLHIALQDIDATENKTLLNKIINIFKSK